jgi:hypothetical protein
MGEKMTGNTSIKKSTTKIMAIFFPLKPLKNKFSNSFISTQISEFIPKLKKYSDKAILYKIDKERFYTFDFKKEAFDDKFEVVDNQTIVVIFSVDKSENVDISDMFEEDFFKSVNTIRIHRKRVDPIVQEADDAQKPYYVFYTINSTRLLNSIISVIQTPDPDSSKETKTFFILSANNARRNIDPTEKSFSTEKICRMNYITTIDLMKQQSDNFTKSIKRKMNFQINF